MADPTFDVAGARAAGYSDDEILQHLTSTRQFDITGAQQAGYSKAEMIDYLSGTQAKPTLDQARAKLQAQVAKYPAPSQGGGVAGTIRDNLSNAYGAEKAFWSTLAGKIPGLLNPLGGMVGPMNVYRDSAEAVARLKSRDYDSTPPLLDTLGAAVGADPNAIRKAAPAAAAGYPPAVGQFEAETAAPLLQLLGMGAASRSEAPMGIGRVEAAESIKNAVNPPPQTAPKYADTLKQQMGNVINFAEQNKLPITDRASMADVMKQASDSYRQKYYGYLKPIENDIITPPANYQGALRSNFPQPEADLGQLEARLTEINATLNPAYEKGGGANISSQAAVSAESKSALRAEANAIRAKLYPEIAKRNNIAVEDVATARNNMGALNYLAEKTGKALNVEQFAANKQANQPIRLDTSASGFGLSQAEKFINNVMGKKADRTTASIFRSK